MGQKYVIHPGHLFQAQVTDAGAGIDQDIVIQQQRGGAPRAADTAIAAEYRKFHFSSGHDDQVQALTLSSSLLRIKTRRRKHAEFARNANQWHN